MGPDEMHLKMLKELADITVRTLYTIFEKSWRLGEVPDDWRKMMNPIPQKAKRTFT